MQRQSWKSFSFAVLLASNGANLFGIKVDTVWAANSQISDTQNDSALTIKYVLTTTTEVNQSCHQPQLDIVNYDLPQLGSLPLLEAEDNLCQQQLSDLPSLYSQRQPNRQSNQAPSIPQKKISIPVARENLNKSQQDNPSPQLETVPNNFPTPSSPAIEKVLPTPEIDYSQRLERLRRRLEEVKSPLPQSNTDLELGLRVRQRPLLQQKQSSQPPLEQQPPPPTTKPVPQFKPIGYLQGRVGYFNTSNIFSAKEDPKADGLMFAGITLASAYFPLGRKTFLNGSIDGSLTHYTNQSQYDYNQIRFNLGIYQQLSPRMYGEIGWSNQQLFYTKNGDSPNTFKAGDRFLNETALRLSLGRRDPLSSKLTIDSFYELSLNIADPDSRNRIINSLWVSLSYKLQKPLQVGLNYQLSLSNFTQGQSESRRDEFHRLFGNLTYRMSDLGNINAQTGVVFGNSTEQNISFDGWFFSINYNFDLGQF